MREAISRGLLHEDSDDYAAFRARYRADPVGFAENCVRWRDGETLADYQREALAKLVEHHRVSLRAPHGVGKSAVSAITVLWFVLTRDGEDWKVATTASAWRQLTRYLWPEIHKWARRLDWGQIGRHAFDERRELLTLSLTLATGQAFAMASNNAALLEGAHADQLLYLFDEAKAIPAATFDAAEGAFSGAGDDTPREAFALATSTPGAPSGRFYDIQRRAPGTENWWVRHITLDEGIAAGRLSRGWADQMKRLWGEGSALYQNRVLGEFAAGDEDGVIPLAWLEAAQDRWRELRDAGKLDLDELPPCTAVALDVADGGPDRSILVVRHDNIVAEARDVSEASAGETMALAGKVKGVVDARGGLAVVDGIGVGAGVVSRLREQKVKVLSFNSSAAAKDTQGRPLRDSSGEMTFVNLRAAAWWRLRELLHPETGDDIAICADETKTSDGQSTVADRILGDLTAPRWRVDSAGRIGVEAKDDLRKPDRLGRSPDYGDDVVMVMWPKAGHASSRKPNESEPRRRPETAGIRDVAW